MARRFFIGFALLGSSMFAFLPSAAAAEKAKTLPLGDPLSLSQRIDQHIEGAYTINEVVPAPLGDDSEFLRRVYLDLAGRIPSTAEVYKFLDSQAPNKRQLLVEELLENVGYVNYFSSVWGEALVPPSANARGRAYSSQLRLWLQNHLREETPLDDMVHQLLSTPVAYPQGRRTQTSQNRIDPYVRMFYQANEYKPENLAASTSRLFLGIKLECAQCHPHPFAEWSQEQFWELAAFFAGFQSRQVGARIVYSGQEKTDVHEIAIPDKDKTVRARFLNGAEPVWKQGTTPRKVLADWIVARDNPYFAKAMANRVWAHFFGIGIVEPIDEFGEANPASHPELLEELAVAFAENDFDLKYLIRAIVNSKAYQRSSAQTDPTQEEVRLFARMAIKGMSAQQLFDSLAQATGYQDNVQTPGRVGNFTPRGSLRAQFLTKFDNVIDKRTEHQTSILQALAMMNGQLTANVTSLENSRTLTAILDSPFMDDEQRLDTLFLATLSRKMRPEERGRFLPYIRKGGPTGDTRKALADVFWVLLNCSEFSLNH